MKTLQLPDDMPMVLVTRFCRQNGMSINWLGNGVYRAERTTEPDPLKAVVSDERIKAE